MESSDLLSFRTASVGCYRLVHGTRSYNSASTNTRGSDNDNDVGITTSSASAARDGEEHVDGADKGGDDDNDDDDQKESENLWRQMLARDFGFCHNWDVRCGDEDGTLKGNMHLRTFRDPDEAEYIDAEGDGRGSSSSPDEAAFLRTDQEMIADDSFESWKRWERLRLRFDKEARSSAIALAGDHPLALGGNGDFTVPPRADENFFIVGPFFLRCAKIWRTIETWCKNSRVSGSVGQSILTSLLPGRALPLSKTTLRYEPYVPEFQPVGLESLIALYAFYIGQSEERERRTADQLDCWGRTRRTSTLRRPVSASHLPARMGGDALWRGRRFL